MIRRAALFALAIGAAGCPEHRLKPCAPSLPSRLELRDGTGALELSMKDSATAGASDLCDASARRIGVITSEPDAVTLLDAAGRLALRLRRPPGEDAIGDGPKGARLRVHRDGAELRVLAPDGVAFGSVTIDAAGAQLFDKAGRPLGRVQTRGADQLVIAPDGATRAYVIGAATPAAAAAFGLEGLSAEERLALSLLFSRF